MAVPKRRTSKTRKRQRRSHLGLKVSGLIECPNCKATIKAHTICPECGYYDNKQVIVKEDDKKEKETKKPAKPKKAKPDKKAKKKEKEEVAK
jgi:large subunit ribosomal protein L32